MRFNPGDPALMVAAYGSPSMMIDPYPQTVPVQMPQTVQVQFTESKKTKLRVSTRCEEDGELKLKVYVNDVLVYEASSTNGTTLTMESSI